MRFCCISCYILFLSITVFSGSDIESEGGNMRDQEEDTDNMPRWSHRFRPKLNENSINDLSRKLEVLELTKVAAPLPLY